VKTQRVEAKTGFQHQLWKRVKAWTSFSK